MKKVHLFTFLILIITSCDPIETENSLVNAASSKQGHVLISEVDSIMYMYSDSGFVGVVLVADSNKIILNKAYGRSKTPLDSATAFWIASNTKPITAIAIMKLVEDRKLSVKDSLPQFFKKVPLDKIHITIEQLLTHSSGLPSEFIVEGERDLEIAVEKILSQKLISVPGKLFNYTNDGYVLLAAIIELSSKTSYQSYVRKEVFEKAGMSDSNFWGDENVAVDSISDTARFRPFYKKIFKGGKPMENWNGKGAAGISSNTNDLYKLLIALRNRKLLNKNSLLELFKPRYEIDKTNDTILSYAYGWAIVDSKGRRIEIRHRGRGDWMHNNSMYYLEKGYILIVWSKDNGPNGKSWSTEVSKHLIKKINSVKEKTNTRT